MLLALAAALGLGTLVEQHALAAAVAVDRHALAAALPGGAIDVGDESLGNAVGKVDRHGNRMVDPLLDRALHLDLGDPVDAVGGSLVVRRRLDPRLQLAVGDRSELRGVVAVGLEPLDEIVENI